MKKFLAIVVAFAASLSFAAPSLAADETVVGTTNITPLGGKLYQAKPLPVELQIKAEVSTPASSPKVNPLKNTKFALPKGLSFNPNNKKTPVCDDKMLDEASDLADPQAVVASCPESIVGTGESTIIIGKINNNPILEVSDPILIIFNAGTDNKGRPKIKVYAFSDFTNVGILMRGTLVNGVLDVAVPVLSSDSAVKVFTFNIPGQELDRTDTLGIKVRGLDQEYARATCPSGTWVTNSEFILGERTYPGGEDTTPEVLEVSPETTQPCQGDPGKAKLAASVKGPKAVKSGAKGAFKVTVRNNGTGIAKAVKVTATGGGKANAGNINPGASKTVTVKTKVTGRKGSRKTLTFTAKGGANARAKIKVQVK